MSFSGLQGNDELKPKDFLLKCNTYNKDKLDMYWKYDAKTETAKSWVYQYRGDETGWRKNEWDYKLHRFSEYSLVFKEGYSDYYTFDREELYYYPQSGLDTSRRYCEFITQAEVDEREQQFQEDVANFVPKKRVNKI